MRNFKINHMQTLSQKEVSENNVSTAFASYVSATYDELNEVLGSPTYDLNDGLDKSNFEWVIEFAGYFFTIYDWKCTAIYSINERNLWHLGAEWRRSDNAITLAFTTELNKKIAELRTNRASSIDAKVFILTPNHGNDE